LKIHFIGIGGIGISGLAQFLHLQGHEVSGSDISDGVITKKLRALGINITIPHDPSAITDQELVIHSAIIKPTNPEIIEANAKNIKILARREALLDILHHAEVYAVAGAHGKSTTTAILTAIMSGSAIIGAESKAFDSNIRYDKSTTRLIFEADESDGSFLNSNPYCSIVINAEPEHMEYYNYDKERFFGSYEQFIKQAKLRVLNAEDPFLATLMGKVDAIWLHPSKDISNISYTLIDDEPHTTFSLSGLGEFSVWGFGAHIALDASLAILAANESMDVEEIRKKILNFKGIKKRFDIVAKSQECVVVDDYGHHPTEIKATLGSAKEYARLKGLKKITAIWQPHKFSRTLDNLEEFITCFDGCDELIILPVWAAGEAFVDINFKEHFKAYNLTLATTITQQDGVVSIKNDGVVSKTIDSGLIIGFGAGDLTYQIRGAK
jgi:UDP-N-acetylmuramate--alanine ligase